MKQILVIDAHPAQTSLCSALAKAYATGASVAKASTNTICLRDLQFDPVLHEGYAKRQDWEPDLKALWQSIIQADHICFIYPTWWGGHPALLQGIFERVFLPGKVARYHEKGSGWDKLLSSKTSQIITTMDTQYWYYRLINRNCGIKRVKQTILEFTGMKTQVCAFGKVKDSSQSKRESWIKKVEKLGLTAAG